MYIVTSFTRYADDIFNVTYNFHIQIYKFGGIFFTNLAKTLKIVGPNSWTPLESWGLLFTESALWAYPVIESPYPSVCLFVCLSVCASAKHPLPEVMETFGQIICS